MQHVGKSKVTKLKAKAEAAAKERYGQLVLQKQNDGYTSQKLDLHSSTVLGDTKASWFGYKANSLVNAGVYNFVYAYNTEINSWVVVTPSGDTISQNI